MVEKTLNPKIYHALLGVLIVAFVLLKLEALTLPFFWDEAWVYLPAIRTMAEQGPSIMPGSIDADLYTGHPLLFYFMSSTWIKMWGYSLPIAHSFPMLISIGLIVSVYVITYHFAKSYFTALIAAVLVIIQPIFLAQSSYLLIEVWLGLLFVWAFYFYFTRNWLPFCVVVALALWSKESAFTLVPAFGLLALYELATKQLPAKKFAQIALMLVGCFVLGFSFFIIQKFKLGWLFFPRHANWINLDEAWYKFKGTLLTLFVSQGRTYFYAAALIILAIAQFVFKVKLAKQQYNFAVAAVIFSFGFITFASINFISTRYLFGALPLLLTSLAFCLGTLQQPKYQVGLLIGLMVLGAININKSHKTTNWSDVDLNYTRMLKAQVNFIAYLKQEPPQAKVFAPFLMCTNLANPYSGFIDKPFLNLSSSAQDSSVVYYINIPNEPDAHLNQLIETKQVVLVKRIEERQAWIELYKKITH